MLIALRTRAWESHAPPHSHSAGENFVTWPHLTAGRLGNVCPGQFFYSEEEGDAF